MNDSILIVFEGIDRSGKSSLMEAFNKHTNYLYPCVDRLYVSHAYYQFKRTDDVGLLSDAIQHYGNSLCDGSIKYINVLCSCDYDIWKKRMEDTDHDVIHWQDNKYIHQVSRAMATCANIDGPKMHNIFIDTTISVPEICAEELHVKLNEIIAGEI